MKESSCSFIWWKQHVTLCSWAPELMFIMAVNQFKLPCLLHLSICPVLFMWKPIISLFSIYNGFIQLMLITLEFKSSILSSIRFVLVNFCFVKDCVCEMDNPESLPSMYFSFCCRCGNWKQRRGYRLKDGLYETAHRSLIKLDICEVYLSCLTK